VEQVCRLRAKGLLAELAITEPPVDVERVATACGLQVEYVSKGRGFSGQLLRARRLIEVERDSHPHRQRFTIAHEIGHYVLNHNSIFCTFEERSSRDPTAMNEKQAHIFASELLMPDPWVRDYWQRMNTDYRALARKFFVSDEAMFRRLEEADLLGL
jgi:Zn-dependent peptidase ImmA (M78 family)